MSSNQNGKCDFGPWEVSSQEGPILSSNDADR